MMMLNYKVSFLALYSSLVLSSCAFINIQIPQQKASYKDSPKQDEDRLPVAASSNTNAPDTAADSGATILLHHKMIEDMTSFLGDMVDDDTERFYALCFPPSGERHHQHNPVRDLAAAWDATKALLFFGGDSNKEEDEHALSQQTRLKLEHAIYHTIQPYMVSFTSVDKDDNGAVALDSTILLEPSNIAHSALMLLASTGALRLSVFKDEPPPIDSITRGILSMQRPDGGFCIHFGKGDEDSNVYRGIDFYPGEGMVALMEVYELSSPSSSITHKDLLEDSTRQDILPAMERAFDFYSNYYHQGDDVDTNYNIWQIQAFSRLFYTLYENDDNSKARAALVATHVLSMCQDVIASKSWKYELARGRSFYPNLETVEIACGLDALADGIRVARRIQDNSSLEALKRNAKNAVYFLEWAQDQVPSEVTVGRGGLGYGGVMVLEQRLDVTGHALSALTKLSPPCTG